MDRVAKPLVPIEHVRAGAMMSVLGGVALLGYVATTWERSGRLVLVLLAVLALVSAAAFASPVVGRLLHTRWAVHLWMSWSSSLTLAVAVGVALDGGAGSPLVGMLMLPLMFAGLSYPPRMAMAVAIFSVVACAFVLIVITDAGLGYSQLILSILVSAGGLCIWQSRRMQSQHAQLELISRTDYLTGALNRRGFEERLAAHVAHRLRDGEPFSVLLFDLDDFKAVNDALGHAAGDELLRWTAQQLDGELRPTDDLARLGGDEFAVLLAGCDATEAPAALERFTSRVRLRAALSGGAASCPADGDDAGALYRVADARLYADKRGSRAILG